ncbi:MAG: TetR/AcrR family transcriptional regulator [Phycisphaerae bacterium]|nr:TetR/AcrR family transcriptional regulator [Phycisphaerae bacterium]
MARTTAQKAKKPRSEPRKRAKGPATRAGILALARNLFSVHGYHATGIADIFEASGLSKGAFYYHFHTKQALAMAILDEIPGAYERELIAPAAAMPSPGARLREMLRRAVALNRRGDWCNCQLLMTLAADLTDADGALHDRIAGMFSGMFDLWRDAVAAAQASGEVRADVSADVCAQWLVFTIMGFLLSKKLGGEHVPAEHVVEAALAFLGLAKGDGQKEMQG